MLMLAVQALKPGALDHEKAWCILPCGCALFICLLGSLEWDFTQCISEWGACHFDAEVLHCTVLNLSTISLMFIHINQYVER